MRAALLMTMILGAGVALAQTPPSAAARVAPAPDGPWTAKVKHGKTVYATLKTTAGDIVIKLYSKKSPQTVANFVGLASGEKEWTDPATGQKTHRPLYDGTIFHRVIPGFMIQGGDPQGTGEGEPGYVFEDEVNNGLTFNKVGLVAMANRGPNTNGSQFFITDSTPHQLDGHYSIFGEVVQGYDVVETIAHAPRGFRDRPDSPTTIQKVILGDRAPHHSKKKTAAALAK